MAYEGYSVSIPLGQAGLLTDDAASLLPINSLAKANNVVFESGRISKSLGCTKFNASALSGEIVSLFDYWPDSSSQRLIALTSDGKMWVDSGDGTFSGGVPSKTGLGVLTTDCHMMTGGAESSGRNKKLFAFTGTAQVQVLDGDTSIPVALSSPSADWSAGNYPTFGIVYQNRLCVMGSSADPHRLYFSTVDDHEDFTTGTPYTASIYPGEGDGIKCAAIYRGLLFIFKAPYGVYVLDGRDPDTANWTISRYSDAFGVASPHTVLQVLGDLIAGNSFGSITSLQASDKYGDFEAGDVLANNKIERYIREQLNFAGLPYAQSLYYPEKKIAYFTGQSTSADLRNRIIAMDVSMMQPRISLVTKDEPNCLALRKDGEGIGRPIYGDKNGHVYLMDQNTYNLDGSPFLAEFQTNYTDLGQVDPALAGKNKLFDFIEVTYIATGNNVFYCDVYVDNQLRDTKTFNMTYGIELDNFELDVDELAGAQPLGIDRLDLNSCTGKRISLRFYNNGNNQGFKVEKVILSFRVSSEQVYTHQL